MDHGAVLKVQQTNDNSNERSINQLQLPQQRYSSSHSNKSAARSHHAAASVQDDCICCLSFVTFSSNSNSSHAYSLRRLSAACRHLAVVLCSLRQLGGRGSATLGLQLRQSHPSFYHSHSCPFLRPHWSCTWLATTQFDHDNHLQPRAHHTAQFQRQPCFRPVSSAFGYIRTSIFNPRYMRAHRTTFFCVFAVICVMQVSTRRCVVATRVRC